MTFKLACLFAGLMCVAACSSEQPAQRNFFAQIRSSSDGPVDSFVHDASKAMNLRLEEKKASFSEQTNDQIRMFNLYGPSYTIHVRKTGHSGCEGSADATRRVIFISVYRENDNNIKKLNADTKALRDMLTSNGWALSDNNPC